MQDIEPDHNLSFFPIILQIFKLIFVVCLFHVFDGLPQFAILMTEYFQSVASLIPDHVLADKNLNRTTAYIIEGGQAHHLGILWEIWLLEDLFILIFLPLWLHLF